LRDIFSCFSHEVQGQFECPPKVIYSSTEPPPDSKTRFEETMNKKTMPPSNRILVEGTMDEKGGVNLKATMHIAILC